MGEEEDWRNQTLDIAKIKRNGSVVEFSEIEQIVMENVELRKENSGLRREAESAKESLCILASILESERRQMAESRQSSPRGSYRDLRVGEKY